MIDLFNRVSGYPGAAQLYLQRPRRQCPGDKPSPIRTADRQRQFRLRPRKPMQPWLRGYKQKCNAKRDHGERDVYPGGTDDPQCERKDCKQQTCAPSSSCQWRHRHPLLVDRATHRSLQQQDLRLDKCRVSSGRLDRPLC
jgi:hypothetical protein